jgi:Concanavalin A-like lectin/glucanases superfamily
MRRLIEYVLLCFLILTAKVAAGQGVATTTYYLHKETVAPWTTTPTLRVANPDMGSSSAQSANYRNVTAPYLDGAWKIFRSVAPSTPGTIIPGSTVTFTAYLKKSSSFGTVYPYFKLWTYNNDDVMTGSLIPVCSATGSVALDTSITKYVVSCTTSVSSPMTATRAYRMDVGSYVTVSPNNHNVTVTVYFDGVSFSGSYPSSVAIPNSIYPAITGLSPSSGFVGTSVTISGLYFGDTQGTVTFNGASAPITNWSNTSIQAVVPLTASGPVVVNVNGALSNSKNFGVITPIISDVQPGSGTVGMPVTITGANFGPTYSPTTTAVLFNGVETTPTSWSDTSIQAPVPSTTSGPVVVRINGVNSNSFNFTVLIPIISGLAPSSGYVGSAVTINGSGFGTAFNPGTMRVLFNDVAAIPTSWSDTKIRTRVPLTTTGPVVVQINSVTSNSANFTVLPNATTSVSREYIYLGDRPLAVDSGSGAGSSPGGYAFYRSMTINHTLVPANLANFPVLVAKTHSHLKSVSNGGWIQHLDGGKPADLAFFSNPDLTAPLDFEVERYDPVAGELLAWVRVSSLSSTADTVFYLAYGNAGITGAQDHSTAVWDSNFKFVGHLPNGTTLSAADSTSYGNSGTLMNGPTAATGKVDGAANLNAAALQHISLPANFNHGSAAMTWSAWIKATSLPNAYNAVLAGVAPGNAEYTRILVRGDGRLALSARSDFPSIYGDLSYDGGANTIVPGTWYYVTMTAAYTGGNPASRMTGYANGVVDGTDGSLMFISPMTQPVKIGRDPITTPRDWDGVIDEIRISNVERSAAWVRTEYNTQASPDTFVVMGNAVVP